VTGETSKGGWAVGGFDTSFNGGTRDPYVARINANGTLAWSSYLGGSTTTEYGNGVAVDGSGNAWVTGLTQSSGWTAGGFDTSYNGGTDAFIAKITAGLTSLSSQLAGSFSSTRITPTDLGLVLDAASSDDDLLAAPTDVLAIN
jgi:hypothetical protein